MPVKVSSTDAVLARQPDQLADLVGLLDDVVAAHRRPAGVRAQQGGQEPDGRGLAGTVRTQQPEHGARLDRQVDAGQGRRLSEALDQSFGLDRVRHLPPSSTTREPDVLDEGARQGHDKDDSMGAAKPSDGG